MDNKAYSVSSETGEYPRSIDLTKVKPDEEEVGKVVAEMEKRADTGDISVLFFLSCANFLAVYAQTDYKHCAVLYCAKSN